MNILCQNEFASRPIAMTLVDYIERRLYENREEPVEAIQANVETLQGAFAQLCEILVRKNILALSDLPTIVDGCEELTKCES